MFSMGKADPRLYSRTLASAGMSCVVVTSTFTQLLLRDGEWTHNTVQASVQCWVLVVVIGGEGGGAIHEQLTESE